MSHHTKFPPSPIDRNNVADQAERLNVLSMDEGLRADLAHEDPCKQLKAATSFSNQALAVMPNVQGFKKAKVVPILVRNINDPNVQKEVLSSITKVAAISSEYAKVVAETKDCLEILVSLISSPDNDVKELAINAIGTIACGNPDARDIVLESEAMEGLISLVSVTTIQQSSMLRTSAWALSNLCGGFPPPPFSRVKESIGTMVRLINAVDEEVIACACWTFSSLSFEQKPKYTHTKSDEHIEKLQLVLDGQIARRLVDLLTHRSMAVQLPAVKTVGNIAFGNEQQIQVLLDNKVIEHLAPLLSSSRTQVRAEACRALGNIASAGPIFIQAVIDGQIMPRLMTIATRDSVQVVKEVIIVFSNLLKGTDEQVKYVVGEGCVGPLSYHVLASNSDAALVFCALEATENVLKVGERINPKDNPYCHLIEQAGGIERFDLLQFHNNSQIYHKSNEILRKYFKKVVK